MLNTGYYVTVQRGKRTGWLFGPVANHDAALNMVEPVRRIACDIDPWCDFDGFGTSKLMSNNSLPKGKLNNRLALPKSDLFCGW